MKKTELVKVTYEALGKVHVKFTDNLDEEFIHDTVRLIAPTAIVVDLEVGLFNMAYLKTKNLNEIVTWSKQFQNRFNHLDNEALI